MYRNKNLQFCPNPLCGAMINTQQLMPAGRCWKCGNKVVMGSDNIIRGEVSGLYDDQVSGQPDNDIPGYPDSVDTVNLKTTV